MSETKLPSTPVPSTLESLKTEIHSKGWTWQSRSIYHSKDVFAYKAAVIGPWGKMFQGDGTYTTEVAALTAALTLAKGEVPPK